LLSTAARAVLIQSRCPIPFSPPLRSPRARAEPSRVVPPPASHRPNPAAPARFFAPQAASPCPTPTPPLPELGRAVSRPESSRHHRPPLMLPSSSAPPVNPHPPASLHPHQAHSELARELLILPNLFPLRVRRRRCRSAAAPPWPSCSATGARRGLPLRELACSCRAHRRPLPAPPACLRRPIAGRPCAGGNAAAAVPGRGHGHGHGASKLGAGLGLPLTYGVQLSAPV